MAGRLRGNKGPVGATMTEGRSVLLLLSSIIREKIGAGKDHLGMSGELF